MPLLYVVIKGTNMNLRRILGNKLHRARPEYFYAFKGQKYNEFPCEGMGNLAELPLMLTVAYREGTANEGLTAISPTPTYIDRHGHEWIQSDEYNGIMLMKNDGPIGVYRKNLSAFFVKAHLYGWDLHGTSPQELIYFRLYTACQMRLRVTPVVTPRDLIGPVVTYEPISGGPKW